jgi:molecular chaperone DnaK
VADEKRMPITIGIETKDGSFTPVIPRNTLCPVRKQVAFMTVLDFQTRVEVHVLQGESERAEENASIMKFELPLPRAPKGGVQILVSLHVDDEWNLHVSATESSTLTSVTRTIARQRESLN